MRIPVLTVAILVASRVEAQGTWKSEQTRKGDTTIVRTISGSVWRDTMTLVAEKAIGTADGDEALLFGQIISVDVDGGGNMYVLDRQAFQVRMFSPAGVHVRSMGRKGGGPGEFENPLAMKVTNDGRVVVRDRSRYTAFSAAGAYSHGWNLRSNFYAVGAPVIMTSDLRILTPTFGDGRMVWSRIDGTPLDTVQPPQRMSPAPQLEVVSQGGGRATYSIRYMPGTAWAVSQNGKFISARTDRYEIDVPRADGTTLRIARDVPPTPVPAAEADRIRNQTVQNIKRSNNPAYEWNGPAIPKTKPLITSMSIGTDGTLWVFRSTPSFERKVDPDVEKSTGFATAWTSSTVADIFDAQGRFLGAVKFPEALMTYPMPVLSGTTVWGIANHADGYPQIVRYRVQR